ncbi:peptidylprolyl isomerase [Desulfopila sp. IMCC35008]|uniref:peptidylprolyl isomerase n=1 Tax=Desulfopila sp. IMCC35008 TaxID=2653858 RepID=UPI0013D3659B|nr:peptidylprolyl isomerase [Desulfopila sp. IMCC35008]
MNRIYIFILTVFFFTTIYFQTVSAEMVDRIVAVVNDDIITLSELDEEAEGIYQRIAASVPSEQLQNELMKAREQILDTLIDKRLIAQKAEEQKLSVSDAEVEQALQDVLSRTGMTMQDLVGKLHESGVTEEVYRSTLKSQLLQNKLISNDVQRKIIVTDEMMLDYYDLNYTSKVDEGSYYLLQMGFNWSSADKKDVPGAKEDARKRAQRVHKLATSGQDFRTLARKFSDLPSAVDGGDLGTFLPGDMAEYMKHAVIGLKTGEVSEIVETRSGYQFFKLLSMGDGEIMMKAPFESVKDEIKRILFDKQMKEAYTIWVTELKQNAYIQKM